MIGFHTTLPLLSCPRLVQLCPVCRRPTRGGEDVRPPHQRHKAPGPRHGQPVKAENCQHPHQQAGRLGHHTGPEVRTNEFRIPLANHHTTTTQKSLTERQPLHQRTKVTCPQPQNSGPDWIGPPVNVIFPGPDRVSHRVSKRNYSAEWLDPSGAADWPGLSHRQTDGERESEQRKGC